MTNAESKARLRSDMLARRALRTAKEQTVIADGIFERAKHEIDRSDCKVIFLYHSIADEISTQRLLDYSLSIGKTVCLPKCEAQGRMSAHQVLSRADLTEIKYGIPEPDASCAEMLPAEIDLIFAPCLCTDRNGYRLGYGGGYYDRFLSHAARAYILALCPFDCVLPSVHPDAFDFPCHAILTEREVLRIHEK